MNKHALIGKIIFLAILLLAVIIAIIYLTGTFTFRTGKVTVNIDYDQNQFNDEGYGIVEIPDGEEQSSSMTESIEEFINETNFSDFDLDSNSSYNTTLLNTNLTE